MEFKAILISDTYEITWVERNINPYDSSPILLIRKGVIINPVIEVTRKLNEFVKRFLAVCFVLFIIIFNCIILLSNKNYNKF
jgi:hypothetical protein